jgi:4-amino-4-deoxy-L-arabinose transferase-like glycosyltransferase
MIDSRIKGQILILISCCLLIYLVGAISVPLMEIDAAQYANISREMLGNHHFLQVYDRGQDYLDKPPMLFWLSALSMDLFGIHQFAYRLPSLLFALLAIYSVYRFCLLFYREEIALLSALVLAGCQALFLITHDVRTDTMLMGWVTLSLWQLANWYRQGSWSSLLIASAAIAGGMMTKGPIALLVPVFAFVPHFVLRREFRQFFRWEYLILLIFVAALLLPMDIGLYRQFDLHPEKTEYGQQHVSGLRFFYWTQSFGRITGESTWHESAGFIFLFQNMLWSFLPWILFFVLGLFREFMQLFQAKGKIGAQAEWISTGGFLLTYAALACSRYQLPHYIFVVFPLAAVVTGKFLFDLLYDGIWPMARLLLLRIHAVVFPLLFVALLILLYWSFPDINSFSRIVAWAALAGLIILLAKPRLPVPRLLLISIYSILWINFILDVWIYPRLLQYQQSIQVARIIQDQQLPKNRFFIYHTEQERSLQFYSNASFRRLDRIDSLSRGDFILTGARQWDSLSRKDFRLVYEGEGFHVTTLSLDFLNPATREREVTCYCILERR